MLFSVIYTVDCVPEQRLQEFQPPQLRKLWQITEGDEEYKYCGLAQSCPGGKHRKYVALLTKEQFDAFVDKTCLYANEIEGTSLGAPGTGYAMTNAIVFDDDPPGVELQAYVTPILQVQPRRPVSEKRAKLLWRRTKRAMLRRYAA